MPLNQGYENDIIWLICSLVKVKKENSVDLPPTGEPELTPDAKRNYRGPRRSSGSYQEPSSFNHPVPFFTLLIFWVTES